MTGVCALAFCVHFGGGADRAYGDMVTRNRDYGLSAMSQLLYAYVNDVYQNCVVFIAVQYELPKLQHVESGVIGAYSILCV